MIIFQTIDQQNVIFFDDVREFSCFLNENNFEAEFGAIKYQDEILGFYENTLLHTFH